jgi:hypothetical protein
MTEPVVHLIKAEMVQFGDRQVYDMEVEAVEVETVVVHLRVALVVGDLVKVPLTETQVQMV